MYKADSKGSNSMVACWNKDRFQLVCYGKKSKKEECKMASRRSYTWGVWPCGLKELLQCHQTFYFMKGLPPPKQEWLYAPNFIFFSHISGLEPCVVISGIGAVVKDLRFRPGHQRPCHPPYSHLFMSVTTVQTLQEKAASSPQKQT